MKKIKLISQEGEAVYVDIDVASKSQLIKDKIENSGISEEILLPKVSKNILAKIMEYCEKHRNDNPPEIEKPLRHLDLSELVDSYDYKFIDIELEDIFEITTAADYLNIKSLLDLSCAKLAFFIKGKSPEEIRKTFNIPNEFTAEEEEEQIREENKWAEENCG